MTGTTATTNNSDYIKLRTSPEFKAEIEAFASEREISISALTRLALAEFMSKDKEKKEDK